MTRPILILLAVLVGAGASSFAADAPATPPEFSGRWYVGYGDAKRHSVVGTAEVDKNEKSCTVTLWDPDTQSEFQLTSSEVKREGDTLKIKLDGKSPHSDFVEKNREAFQVLRVAKGPAPLTARVGNMVKKSRLKPQGPVDLDHVELVLKFDQNDRLNGTWKYHADLDTERDRIGFGRVGNFSEAEEEGATVGYQTGPEAWERIKSVIVGVIVLDDQLALKNGQPVYPTPFVADATTGRHRRLFVYGWDLPKHWGDKIQLKGDDATISYSAGVLSQSLSTSDAEKQGLGDGLKRALEGQNPTTQEIIKKMDTMIVTVDLNHGVIAGDHSFVLNGSAPGKWTLLFGDGFARLNFARQVGEKKFDVIQEMLAPELGVIEVHTEVPLPLPDIPLTISRVRGDKEEKPVTVAAHRVDGNPLLYQTDPFGIYEEDRPALANQADAKGKPIPAFPVLAEDKLKVVLTPPLHVQANPKSTTARIAPPHELGSIWKTALIRATRTHADIDLGDVDLNNLSNKSADYLTNYALLEPLYIAVENKLDQAKSEWRDWKTLSGPDWLVKKSKQFYNNRVAAVKEAVTNAVTDPSGLGTVSNVQTDRFTRKIPYTVGDHAALLLLRDGFVKMMTEAASRMDQQRSAITNDRAFRAMIAAQLQDEQSPFSRILVTPPASYRSTAGKVTAYLTSGEVVNDIPAVMALRKLGILDAQHGAGLAYSTDIPLRFAVNPDFLQEFFPNDPAGAEAWSLQAVHEGYGRYRQAIADSIAKAQGVADKDVAGLLDIVSYGFEPVAEQITPHLLKLQDSTEPGQYHYQWVPDDQAREVINHIDTFVEAVRAQKDYAKLDTQMVLVMMSVATLPAMWTDAAWAAYLAAAADATMAGVTVVESVGELKKNWEDQHFALGASIVVGIGRYDEAVAADPGFWSTVANVAGAVGPAVFSGWNAATKFRFASQLDKMEKGGAAAFRELSPSAQKDFMAFAEEARAQRATQGSSSLSKTQERTLAVWDGLAEEAHPGVATGGKPGVEAPKVASGEEPKKPATAPTEGGDHIAPKLEDETGGIKVADTTPHDNPTGPKVGEPETPKQPGEAPKVAENNPGEKPPKPQPEPTTPQPNEPKPPKVADNPPPETPGGGKTAEPPVEPGAPKQPGDAPKVADSGGNKPPRGGVDSNEPFGNNPGAEPREPNHLATDHGGKPADVNTPTQKIEPPTIREKTVAFGAGPNDPTVHLDPTKPPQTPAERQLLQDEIRSRLKQAGVNDAAADFQAYSAAHGDVSLDEAKAGAKSYADFPERRPWKPEPGESADKFAKDLDTYLEKADGVKDPSKRAYAISNYMGEQTPQYIRDRLPDVGDAPTAFNPAKAPVPEPHVPDRPVRFGADPNAPTVNPDHPAALAEHPPAEPGAAHGPAIEAKDSFGHSPGVEPNDPHLATDHGGKPADVNAPTRNVEPPTLPEKPPTPGTGPNDATVHLDPTKPPQTAAEREALRDEIKSRLKQAGVSDFNADAQAHLAVDNGLTLNEAKAGAKDYVDFQNRAKWQPAPGESAQTFANDLDNYLEKTQGAGGKDPAKRANAIANYMGDQTPQNILDRMPEFRDRPTEAIHEAAAPVPEPHVANPHAPDPAPVRFGADPDAPTVNPDHPAALAEHSPAEPAAPRGPPVDPNAHSIHPENPGAPPEAVIDPHAPSIHPENPGAPREAVIDTHAISPENPGAPHEAVIDTSTGPHGISPENPGAPADHPTVIEPGAPRPPAGEKSPPKIEYENPGAPHDAVIDTSTSAHGISPENPGAPPEAVVEPNPRSPKPEPNAGAAKSAPPETPRIEPETPTKTFEPNAGAEKPPAAEPLHEAQFDPNSPTAGAGRPATPETPHETPFDPNAPTHKLEPSPAAGKPAAPEAPAPHEGTPGTPAAPEAAAPKPAAPAVEKTALPREPKYADEAAGFPKKEFPKDGKIDPNTVYTTLPTGTPPGKPFYYQLEDGKTVLLDQKLGSGVNSHAYTIGGAGNEGLIVKFSPVNNEKGIERLAEELMQKEPNMTLAEAKADVGNFDRDKIPGAAEQASRDIVAGAEKASRDLENAHIEQAHVLSANQSAKTPYQINERVTNAEMFKYPKEGGKPIGTDTAPWTPAHEKAVVKLYEKLAESGLVAEDLHVENIYFKKQDDGSYVAGILDHDNIMPWAEAKQTPWFKAMEENPGANGIRSTSRGEQPYQNPTEFMAEMLEHKRWVQRPNPASELQGKMMGTDALKGSSFEKYIAPKPVKPTGWIPAPPLRRGQLVPWPGAPALAA